MVDEPKKVIINEGLHSLYDKDLCKLANLNIFIKVGKSLKYQWKLNRDTEKEDIQKNKYYRDETKRLTKKSILNLKKKQMSFNIYRKTDKSVHLDYECKNEYGCDLMLIVKKLYNLHRGFYSLAESLVLNMN